MTRSAAAVQLREEAHQAHAVLRDGLDEWDKVNALERPYDPQSEPVPDRWTAEHVSRRLLDAMKTLDKTQGPRSPRTPGNHWPSFRPDYAVMVDWESLSFNEKVERHDDLNFVADRPSVRDLSRMEACLSWLRDLRTHDSGLGVILTRWAICKCRGGSVKDLCREKGWSFSNFYRRRDSALAHIVWVLNNRRVSVF